MADLIIQPSSCYGCNVNFSVLTPRCVMGCGCSLCRNCSQKKKRFMSVTCVNCNASLNLPGRFATYTHSDVLPTDLDSQRKRCQTLRNAVRDAEKAYYAISDSEPDSDPDAEAEPPILDFTDLEITSEDDDSLYLNTTYAIAARRVEKLLERRQQLLDGARRKKEQAKARRADADANGPQDGDGVDEIARTQIIQFAKDARRKQLRHLRIDRRLRLLGQHGATLRSKDKKKKKKKKAKKAGSDEEEEEEEPEDDEDAAKKKVVPEPAFKKRSYQARWKDRTERWHAITSSFERRKNRLERKLAQISTTADSNYKRYRTGKYERALAQLVALNEATRKKVDDRIAYMEGPEKKGPRQEEKKVVLEYIKNTFYPPPPPVKNDEDEDDD